MKMSEMYPSKYLSKDDVPQPTRAVIQTVARDEIKGDNGNELKNVVQFQGGVKPLILNRGNAELLCALYGDDSVGWHGKTVELYVDPNVMFAGRRVGGLRLRAPTSNAPQVNGYHAPAVTLWDLSDGAAVFSKQTTEQVQSFLSGFGGALQNVRIKPAGTGREQAQTADLWLGAHSAPAADDDNIPF